MAGGGVDGDGVESFEALGGCGVVDPEELAFEVGDVLSLLRPRGEPFLSLGLALVIAVEPLSGGRRFPVDSADNARNDGVPAVLGFDEGFLCPIDVPANPIVL